jgi:translation initiation factor 4B
MPVPSSPPFTAFVGNFPYECPREEVVGLFTANACAIADVRMVRNRDTDRPRGYFLEFEDKASLERALTFDQYNMGGRPLRVNVAEGKPDRRDRFGGGGGFADRYNERDRRGGGFADRYNDATGGKPGGGGSFGRREGGAGYQEARGGGGGGGRGDKASFTGGGYHAPRGGGGDRGRRSFDRDPDAPPPEGRKKLELKPRSADADAAQPSAPASGSSSKPNPFGSAKPVDTTAKIAEAERKIQEEKDRVNAKAGVAAKGEVPAPKPLSKSAVQPDAKRKPIVLAPEENAKIEATNVFALLNMDDDEDGDDTEADAKDGDGEEEAKEEL